MVLLGKKIALGGFDDWLSVRANPNDHTTIPHDLDLPGIYVWWDDELDRANYVGETVSFKRRLKQHFKLDARVRQDRFLWRRKVVSDPHFYLLIVPDFWERIEAEASVIDCLMPVYNVASRSLWRRP